ncbi:MAG: DUF4230 domain-containing protein [Acidobacteriota bacterium]|nr:DUF4230 domain-containing protein [Acidobacteriota bacterium]
MKWKIAAFAAVAVALISLALTFYFSGWRSLRRFDAAAVIIEIKPLNQLTTVRYSIQRVVGIKEEKQPFGEESLLLMVQGEVLAGVDLADMTPADIKYLDGRTVAICLPAPKIFQCFIDEKNTKVWDRSITWWTPWVPFNPDLEHKARLTALDEIRKAAASMGILDQAKNNAQTAIKGLLSPLGLQSRFEP